MKFRRWSGQLRGETSSGPDGEGDRSPFDWPTFNSLWPWMGGMVLLTGAALLLLYVVFKLLGAWITLLLLVLLLIVSFLLLFKVVLPRLVQAEDDHQHEEHEPPVSLEAGREREERTLDEPEHFQIEE